VIARLHRGGRTRTAVALGTVLGIVLAACGTVVVSSVPSVAVLVARQRGSTATARDLVALRSNGVVELIDTRSHHFAVIATGADPAGGVSVSPSLEFAFVTGRGHDGMPAVWALPLGPGGGHPVEVVPRAELPAVSPDGGFLGYVMLNGSGAQEGVAITALGAGGTPVGQPQRLLATSVPPPFPIMAIAVGRRDAQLAVWGGFLDQYLGTHQPSLGTLDPATSTSLGELAGACDPRDLIGGDPIGVSGAPTTTKPPRWSGCSAPVYEPDGYLLYGDAWGEIVLPFSQDDGVGGRDVYPGVGSSSVPLESLAFGPGSSIAFVTRQGELDVVPAGAYLPYGPEAMNPPPPTPAAVRLGTGFSAVAWTQGPSAEKTPPPRLYAVVHHLPNLIGMKEARAESILASLYLPVSVTIVGSKEPKGIVTGQNPAPGIGEACQCGVILNVSAGPG
jgi:hypothetical protein